MRTLDLKQASDMLYASESTILEIIENNELKALGKVE